MSAAHIAGFFTAPETSRACRSPLSADRLRANFSVPE
jgi:hypothetical protein